MRPVLLHLTVVLLGVAVLATGSAAGAAHENANISLYHTEADLVDAEEIQAAIANGTAPEAGTRDPEERVVLGDRLVVVIESGHLAARLDAREGTPTDAFFAVLDGDPQLLIHQSNYLQVSGPKVLRVGPQNTTVYRAGNTTYAIVETGSVDVDRPSWKRPHRDRIMSGDEYVVEIAKNASTAPSEGPLFEVIRNESSFVDGPYAPLPPEVNRVAVRTYVEADDEHLVRINISDGREITAPVDASVDEYSDKSAVRIDLSDVEPGTGYTLELVHDGSVVDSVAGTVREPNATLSDVRITEVNGERRLNLTVTLSHGGKVVTMTAHGERRATRRIQPRQETELSIPVVSWRDRVLVPEDGYVRALQPDGAVYPEGVYELGAEGAPVRTPTATPTPSPTPDGHDRHSPPGPTGTAPGIESLPGFGAAVAVLALAAWAVVAALAGHRDRGRRSG